jgi:hypothetical protein
MNVLQIKRAENGRGVWRNVRYLGSFNDYPSSPTATRSALWLSVVAADLPSQLTFVLEANAWQSAAAVPDGGWVQTVEAARAAGEFVFKNQNQIKIKTPQFPRF